MIVTGIADEAARDIEGQIRAHQELGWDHIELRLINGQNVCGALDGDAFEHAARQIEKAGLTVSGFGSAIGNWSRPITGDFEIDVADLRVTAERMKRLGVRFVRTMSWTQGDASEQHWKKEGIERYKRLAEIAEQNDIFLAYENCTGWASEGNDRMAWFLDAVDSDNVVMLYDIGNVVGHGQDPWTFYKQIWDRPLYVHIKDAKRIEENGEKSYRFTFPGEGDAMVPEILADLAARGYSGVVSIEPHIATVIHADDGEASAKDMYAAYIKYGTMANEIVANLSAGAK